MKKKLLISFSGGRTSAFMVKFINEYPKYQDYEKLFVFANTGLEREETLEFVDKCDKEFKLNLAWIETIIDPEKGKGVKYRLVDFKTATRGKRLFEDLCSKHGLPSKKFRTCTRDLKDRPIHKFAKDVFREEYLTALGIRADEPHRIKNKPEIIYPLAHDIQVDEKFIREFWRIQPFDLNLKDYQGNCDLCFLKSKRKRLTIISENPKIAKDWNYLEKTYGNDIQPMFDVRNNLTINDLIDLAKNPFTKALDKQEIREKNTFDPDMDMEYSCFCKSD